MEKNEALLPCGIMILIISVIYYLFLTKLGDMTLW